MRCSCAACARGVVTPGGGGVITLLQLGWRWEVLLHLRELLPYYTRGSYYTITPEGVITLLHLRWWWVITLEGVLHYYTRAITTAAGIITPGGLYIITPGGYYVTTAVWVIALLQLRGWWVITLEAASLHLSRLYNRC